MCGCIMSLLLLCIGLMLIASVSPGLIVVLMGIGLIFLALHVANEVCN